MALSLMSGKELLVALVPGDNGDTVVRTASVSGQRIVATSEGVPSVSPGPLRIALYSLDNHFEQADLAAASVKLLPLIARRHIDAEMVFDDISYRLRARSRSRHERTISADIAVVPEQDIEYALSTLPVSEYPCMQLVPVELSIAALVQKVTREQAIVFWEKGGMLLSLLVADGMVQTRMQERVPEGDRDGVLTRAEIGLRSTASRMGNDREISLTLYMGDLVDHEREPGEKVVQALEKKLQRLYRSSRKTSGDAVLRDPELYGLPFVSDEWDFQETVYRQQVKAWRFARPAAVLAALGGALFGLYGGAQHLNAIYLSHQFDERRAQLNANLEEYAGMRPSDEAMASVRERLDLQKQSFSEVRLDYMLGWLTNLLPHGVVISSLEMKPMPPPRRTTRGEPIEFPTGEKPFDVRMEIVLPDAVLDDAEASAAEVVRRLSQRLQMVDSRLRVPAPDSETRRSVVLEIRAHARAVNFS